MPGWTVVIAYQHCHPVRLKIRNADASLQWRNGTVVALDVDLRDSSMP